MTEVPDSDTLLVEVEGAKGYKGIHVAQRLAATTVVSWRPGGYQEFTALITNPRPCCFDYDQSWRDTGVIVVARRNVVLLAGSEGVCGGGSFGSWVHIIA